jgi:hypothetical protein
MNDQPTTQKYILTDDQSNTERARVDGVTLVKGDLEPKELTEDQVQRLEQAGMKLSQVDSETDAAGELKGAALDRKLQEQGVTVASGTSAEEKRSALKDAVADNENNS